MGIPTTAAAASEILNPVTLFNRLAGWLTRAQHATYSLSALRIIFGFSILAFLVTNFADRQYLWGVASKWVEPEASRAGHFGLFRMLFSKENATLFDLSYLILAALAVLFLVGLQTRVVTPFLLLFWMGLSTNSAVLTNGGDTIMRIALFFLIFANLSQHWSVDAWLRNKYGVARTTWLPRRLTPPSWATNAAHNAAIMVCCYQIMLVYVNSGIFKLQGEEWRNGTAFYYSVVLDVFRPFPGLSDLTWQFSIFVFVATWLSIWVQLTFPVLVLWRPTRIAALVFLLGMHFGIGLFLGLWPFSLAMISLDLLFVRDGSWQRALRWVREVAAVLKEIVVNRRAPQRPVAEPVEAPAPEPVDGAVPEPVEGSESEPELVPATGLAAGPQRRNNNLYELRKKRASTVASLTKPKR
jgi:hypothetical protein